MSVQWLVGVAERAGHACPELPDGVPLDEAWATGATACGETSSGLADLVARHFRLEVANLGVAERAAAKLVPEKVARQFHVFPVREDAELGGLPEFADAIAEYVAAKKH